MCRLMYPDDVFYDLAALSLPNSLLLLFSKHLSHDAFCARVRTGHVVANVDMQEPGHD